MVVIEGDHEPLQEPGADVPLVVGIGEGAFALSGEARDETVDLHRTQGEFPAAGDVRPRWTTDTPAVGRRDALGVTGDQVVGVDEGLGQGQFHPRASVDVELGGQAFEGSVHLRQLVVEHEGHGDARVLRVELRRVDEGQGAGSIVEPGDEAAEHLEADHPLLVETLGVVGGEGQDVDVLVLQGQVADLEGNVAGEACVDGPLPGARTRRRAHGLHRQGLGRLGHQQVVAAGVEDEQERAFAVHFNLRIDVVVHQLERHRRAAGRIVDDAVGQHDLRHGIGRRRSPGGELRLGQGLSLAVGDAGAVVDHLLAGQHDAVDRTVVADEGGDGLEALRLDGAGEQVRLGVEPGLERLAADGGHREYVIGLTIVGLLAEGLDRRPAPVGPPPQIGVLIAFADRDLAGIAAVLGGDGAGRILLPGGATVITVGALGDPGLEGVDHGRGMHVVGGGGDPRQAVADEGVFELKGVLAVEGRAADRLFVGREDIADRVGACSARRQQRRGGDEGEKPHDVWNPPEVEAVRHTRGFCRRQLRMRKAARAADR